MKKSAAGGNPAALKFFKGELEHNFIAIVNRMNAIPELAVQRVYAVEFVQRVYVVEKYLLGLAALEVRFNVAYVEVRHLADDQIDAVFQRICGEVGKSELLRHVTRENNALALRLNQICVARAADVRQMLCGDRRYANVFIFIYEVGCHELEADALGVELRAFDGLYHVGE